ncbi:glycerol-3-phosphate dehydrogenase [Phormidium yuhuli AB48]|uniref:Glycerol-3-phosphate dehydrogenase n=1 Tax=Phormidium yuhuli AB48 TaxID=2940671 RepID=A0ABY5APY5_9CYAN|nr:glycerol-3-phosphate dehydrogenase [Phormidium yuhuli]USR90309.1 glycerol-3-phosphate dehydrogenase [Phormidium yuhuli AB48]
MRNLDHVESQTYDLIIIGGGVNGAAVARDAALRGLKPILLEKGDFASGTSSWSTRLVHGGLRYLEYFEFPLVRESLHERELLLRNAPHLVNPLMLTVPVYGKRSRPYWKIWAGMILYDIFSFDKTLLPHRMLPKRKFKQHFRGLDPENLNGGAQYYDAQASRAERMCLETILDAESAGATSLNYVEVTALHRQGDRITQVTCQDKLTGKTLEVKGTADVMVINTSGPWVDRVLKDGEPQPIGQTRKIGGTKGSHIIVSRFPGAPESALYVEAKTDGRPFFIVPWLGMMLIGTTDLPYEGGLDRVKADDEEIDYLLTETNNIIPSAQLTRESIKFTYSGVRPLPYVDKGSAGSITRKHILFDHRSEGVSNLISLIGGKLTTFRHVGQEIVDLVYKKWKKAAPPCPTLHRPFPGAILPNDPLVAQLVDRYRDRLSVETLYHLLDHYGRKAAEVLALVDEYPELGAAITPELPDIRAQIVYGVRSEYAYHMADILRRRTTIAMQSCYGLQTLKVLSQVLQEYCGWSAEDCDRQAREYRQYMEENCIPDYAIPQGRRSGAEAVSA